MTAPLGMIVGTGHSGTGYVASVLAKAGLRAGHEAWWNPGAPLSHGLHYDVSWLALRDARAWRGGNLPVVLATRDPLLTFKSYALKTTWRNDPDDPYYAAAQALWQRWQHTGNKTLDAAINVVELGTLAMTYAQWTFRVEEMGVEVVRALSLAVGAEVSLSAALDAIRATPTNVNHHGDYENDVSVQRLLEQLPVELLDALNHLRTMWRYQRPEGMGR